MSKGLGKKDKDQRIRTKGPVPKFIDNNNKVKRLPKLITFNPGLVLLVKMTLDTLETLNYWTLLTLWTFWTL